MLGIIIMIPSEYLKVFQMFGKVYFLPWNSWHQITVCGNFKFIKLSILSAKGLKKLCLPGDYRVNNLKS